MADIEKVIKELEERIKVAEECMGNPMFTPDAIRTIVALLKEQEAHEQAICKEICDFIRHACSTDTDDDKDYVCYVIQKCFTHFCADGERQ